MCTAMMAAVRSEIVTLDVGGIEVRASRRLSANTGDRARDHHRVHRRDEREGRDDDLVTATDARAPPARRGAPLSRSTRPRRAATPNRSPTAPRTPRSVQQRGSVVAEQRPALQHLQHRGPFFRAEPGHTLPIGKRPLGTGLPPSSASTTWSAPRASPSPDTSPELQPQVFRPALARAHHPPVVRVLGERVRGLSDSHRTTVSG